jgi:cell division protein FtsB
LTARITALEAANAELTGKLAKAERQVKDLETKAVETVKALSDLSAAKAGLEKANADLEARVKTLSAGAAPVEIHAQGETKPGFVAAAEALAKERGIKVSEAMRIVADKQPELFRAYKAGL